MKTLLNLSLAVLLIIGLNVHASPPLDVFPQKLIQPNGVKFMATNYGNSRFHWKETRKGFVIIKNLQTGYYEYAIIKKINGKDCLAPSGIQVDTASKADWQDQKFTPLKRRDLQALRKASFNQKATKKDLTN